MFTMLRSCLAVKTTLHACVVREFVQRLEKPTTEKIPACTSLRLDMTVPRQRRAYRRQYAATSGLATTDVGLSKGLAYDCVMHMAPKYFG